MDAWAAILGALGVGVTGSGHCALMCGPLACASLSQKGAAAWPTAMAWQLGRLGMYAFVGLLLGAMGRGVSVTLHATIQPVLPWVMAAGLLIAAFDVAKRLPAVPGFRSVSLFLSRMGQTLLPWQRSFLLGTATPFLPCGLLYGLFLAALASASPFNGAAIMSAFALGGVPALGAVQWSSSRIAQFPRAHFWLRRGVPVLAALVLVGRAVSSHQNEVAVCEPSPATIDVALKPQRK